MPYATITKEDGEWRLHIYEHCAEPTVMPLRLSNAWILLASLVKMLHEGYEAKP